MITTCPPEPELSSLLGGGWSGHSIEDLESHLTNCETCRDRLETLSNSSRLKEWLGDDSSRHSPYPYLTPSNRPGDLGRIGRYFVESEIGRGGMGLVFQAWDHDLQRTVALKVLRIGRDDRTSAERFLREARSAGTVRHDHLVPVLDVTETEDGRPVIVMPRIVGQTLRESLKRQSTLTPRQAATIIRQIADGLHAIHSAELIHRDVKPANILLDEADGRAKLTDFGISRSMAKGATITQDGMLVGTPEYLSPEQSTDTSALDGRSDLYSLGATLYECLAGLPPFRGLAYDVIAKHRHHEPVPLRTLNPSIPADLETIAHKLLAKRPEHRYATAADLRDDLDRWLTSRPILARPAGLIERVSKWCTRNPWPVALMAVAIMGLVISSLGWRMAFVESRRSRQREADAIASETKANDNRKLAEERSHLALNAINTLISKAQSLIGSTPGTLELKKQLNEAALTDLRALSNAVSSVPGADRSTISAQLKLGDTFNLLGQSDEAIGQWRLAIQGAMRLLDEDSQDRQISLDLARAHYAVGFTQNRLAQPVLAAEHMDASIRVLRDADKVIPHDRTIQENLAIAYQGRGDVWWTAGSANNAIAFYTSAAEINREWVALYPDDSELKSKLLFVIGRIGYIQLGLLHDYTSAEGLFREQYSLAKSQCDITPNDSKWQRNFRITSLDLSASLQRQGKFTEAEKLARSALKPLADTAAADPENGLAQRDLSSAWVHLGHAQLASDRFADAEVSFDKSREILESVASRANRVALVSSDLPPAYYCLCMACERQGKFGQAAMWIGKMLTAIEARYAANPLQVQFAVKRIKEAQAALLLIPDFLRTHQLPKNLSRQTIASATFFRTTHRARAGHVDEARAEIRAAIKEYPDDSSLLSGLAIIEGIAAQRAKSDRERETCLTAGQSALMANIRADRSTLETFHIAPEIVTIRQQPSFQKELTAFTQAK